jgi:hypothetical protein
MTILSVPKMTQITLELTHKVVACTRLQETTGVLHVHNSVTIRIHRTLDRKLVILCRSNMPDTKLPCTQETDRAVLSNFRRQHPT